VVNRNSPAQVWRNVTPNAGNWIEVKLTQSDANLDAIGARLEVKVGDLLNTREVTIGGGHVSGQLGFWHFGLGAAKDAMVRVTWPNGSVGEWITLDANGFYVLSPDGARPWSP
jgi:enediyne biosynthesis protein E4